MPPKKKKVKKAKAIDYPGEAKAAYHYYLNQCRLVHKCLPNERVSTAFGRVISEVGTQQGETDPKEGGKKKKKSKKSGPKGAEVFAIVDDLKPRSLRALADVLIEYPRAKNLCFWGTVTPVSSLPLRRGEVLGDMHVTESNDAILEVVCSVLNHKRDFRWSKASSPLHVEIVGKSARQLADEPMTRPVSTATEPAEPLSERPTAMCMYDGCTGADRRRTENHDYGFGDGHDLSSSYGNKEEGPATHIGESEVLGASHANPSRNANDQCCFSIEKLTSLSESLAHSTTMIQVLNLNNSTLGDVGFAALYSGLHALKTLKHLGLGYTGLTGASGPLLAELVAGQDSGTETKASAGTGTDVRKRGSHIEFVRERSDSIADIATIMRTASTGKPAALTDTAAPPLVDTVSSLPLQSVTAATNDSVTTHFPATATAVVAAVAPKLHQLESLVLEGNYIGIRGLSSIGIGLQSPFTTVKSLNLAANDITISDSDFHSTLHRESLDDFFRGIAASRHVSKIDLKRNFIGSDALEFLMPALQANTNVSTFRVSAMKLSREVVVSFCSIMGGRNLKAKKGKKKKTKTKKAS